MSQYTDKLARILRIDKTIFSDLDAALSKRTGKMGVMRKIVEENEYIVNQKLRRFNLNPKSYARTISDVLIEKIKEDDTKLFNYIGLKGVSGFKAADAIAKFTMKASPPQTGMFLKREKAKEFLINIPPQEIMASLGYASAKEMVEKEDLWEVFSALRFLEDADWLNNVFFKQYESLTPNDFEERFIEVKALSEKWITAAQKFVKKKYHNVSHLKELGVIFIIPIFMDTSGETLRLISLLMHYLNEVKYYSDLFQMFMTRENFAASLVSLLRGDVSEDRRLMNPTDEHGTRFLIVQRYLAKGDEFDWRLFVPHVNPEAIHWDKAENGIMNIPRTFPDFVNDLGFWQGSGWVGDYFDTDSGQQVLVSFNIVDTVMDLVKEQEFVKYLYHHQEALWNKIFVEYFGEDEMAHLIKENIIRGWFEI